MSSRKAAVQQTGASKTEATRRIGQPPALAERSPVGSGAARLRRLQSSVGNQAFGHLLSTQPEAGAAEDRHERDGDRLAGRVMAIPGSVAGGHAAAAGQVASVGNDPDAHVSLGILDNPIFGALAEQRLGSTQWTLMRELLRGIHGGLQAAPPAQLARINAKFARLGESEVLDYGAGYVLGIRTGLKLAVTDLGEAVVTLVKLPGEVNRYLTEKAPELALKYGPRLLQFFSEGEGISVRLTKALVAIWQNPLEALSAFNTLIEGIKGMALAKARALGRGIARRVLGFIEQPWFAYGFEIGKVVGQVLFEVLLAAASDAIANVVKGVLSLAARLAARLLEGAAELFRMMRRLLGNVLEGLGKLFSGLKGKLAEAFEGIKGFISRLGTLLEELAGERALAGDTGTGFHMPIPEARGLHVLEARGRPLAGGRGQAVARSTTAKIFPRSSLRGVSESWLKRNKPRGWKQVPADTGGGWKWVDENGIERLRFMRPNGLNPSTSKWSRQTNGYLRWQNDAGQFLDIDGNVVNRANPSFDTLTHIMYEGL